MGYLKDDGLLERSCNNLQSDWQAVLRKAARQRERWCPEMIERRCVAGRPLVRFRDRLGDHGSGLTHRGKNEHIHLFKDSKDVAPTLAYPLESLNVRDRVDLLHAIQGAL